MDKWTKDAEKLLKGRKIVAVRYMSERERESLGWSQGCVVLQLDDGNLIYPARDNEGNDAGALFTNDEKFPVIPTSR